MPPVNDPAAFRDELAQWLRHSWDTSITVREWWERLADAGLTMPTWSRPYGGISAPTAIQQLIEREFASAGRIGPPLRGVGLRLVGPALRQHATPDQCRSNDGTPSTATDRVEKAARETEQAGSLAICAFRLAFPECAP